MADVWRPPPTTYHRQGPRTGTMRAFGVDLMRVGNSRKFARWHSKELARGVYEQVTEQ